MSWENGGPPKVGTLHGSPSSQEKGDQGPPFSREDGDPQCGRPFSVRVWLRTSTTAKAMTSEKDETTNQLYNMHKQPTK